MKLLKKLLFIILLSISFILIGNISSNASYQSLNSINYEVYINTDGSMEVIEEWDIYISETNTLFKNFKKDKNKFSEITDVNVTDLTSGKSLKEIYNQMYHVTKDCYYALDIEKNKFEIAWGVGLDNSSANRKYRIEYTVEDAIGKYNDCAELYWQFIGSDFAIDAKEVKGTIFLPTYADSKDMIKVWGHTQALNGEIYVTDYNKVEFNIDKFNSGNYVEVRIAMPTDMVIMSGRTYYTDRYPTILKEEEQWANEANRRRLVNKIIKIIVAVIISIISIIIAIILITKIIKYKKLMKKEQVIKPTQEIKYYREFPRESASPAEAKLLLTKNKFNFNGTEMGYIFSANLLNLYHKNYIDIQEDKNNKNNTKFILKASNEQIESIENDDEKTVYKYIIKAASEKTEITLEEIQKYITEHPSSITKLQKELETNVKQKLYKMKYIDEQKEKEYKNYSVIKMLYMIAIFFLVCFSIPFSILFSVLILIPVVTIISLIIGCIVSLTKVSNQINTYSQEAIDEIEMWKGLKKFMEDLSQIDKKEIPEVVLWEKYLIYATAFGIADKVIKQLKLIYSDFDNQIAMSTSTHVNLILGSSISNAISNSINTSMSSAYSSASGGGGGFSGGGRRRRRPVEVEAEDSLKIKNNLN